LRAPPAAGKKNIGRYANKLEAGGRPRWTVYEEAAARAAPIARRLVDVTLPGQPGRLLATATR
jgi:hypothetical protein